MDAGARKLLLRVFVITAVTLLILSGYVSFSDSFCPWITDLCGSGDAGCRYQFCRNLLAHPAGAAAEGGLTFCPRLLFLCSFLTSSVRPIISPFAGPIFAKFAGFVELLL